VFDGMADEQPGQQGAGSVIIAVATRSAPSCARVSPRCPARCTIEATVEASRRAI
jgi:hypothetical protein